MIKLDEYDKKILRYLDSNSRISATKLSHIIKLPKETINYRINKLLKDRVIEYFFTLINASVIGYEYSNIFLKIDKITKQKENELILFLTKQNNCSNIRVLEGNYNISFLTIYKTKIELENILEQLFNQFGKIIIRKNINVVTNSHKLNSGRFLEQSEEKFFQHIKEENKIDDIDISIIGLLLTDARASMTSLAKEINQDPVKLTYRRKRLESKGIIIGYSIKLNLENIGYQKIQLDISLSNYSSKRNIIEFFRSKGMCVFAYEMIGDFDLDLELIVKDIVELREVMDEFKEKYSADFKEYELSQIYKECSSTWAPFSKERLGKNTC
ncbi:MAG: Lrp/AsnC family transcriptional regulator [archaeon]|jgi:Lrp/AsnC family leucine-responsive transcriptional regulator